MDDGAKQKSWMQRLEETSITVFDFDDGMIYVFLFFVWGKFGIQKDMASWNTQDQGTIVASDVTKMQKQHPWEELIGAKKMARTVPHLKLVALTISTSRFCMMLGCSLGCPNPDSDVPTLFEKKTKLGRQGMWNIKFVGWIAFNFKIFP